MRDRPNESHKITRKTDKNVLQCCLKRYLSGNSHKVYI
jgi:hypothetical protein